MNREVLRGWVRGLLAVATLVSGAGCATQRTLPALFPVPPTQAAPEAPRLLEPRTPPRPVSDPIVVNIPQRPSNVTEQNSITRKGAVIKPGSSVVISVPDTLDDRAEDESERVKEDDFGFRTDGYFNKLEQYIERGLLAVGLQAKDRSKFEAKLRDLRDTGTAVRGADSGYDMVLASLEKDLSSGKLSRDEFADKATQLRDKLLDPTGSSRKREELTDISEVIRAAQDGDVMSDYVLQVNDASVKPFAGTALQLGACPEVQKALGRNPGLRLGGEGNAIPESLPQPWAQARFNAKLIDVKTGSIDWIGEYSIESLAVLENGVTITIGVRRRTANAKTIVEAIASYNNNVSEAYRRAVGAKENLDGVYRAAAQPVTYKGKREQGEAIQRSRRQGVEQAENAYRRQMSEYRDALQRLPAEARMEWTFEYDVDAPIVVPDLLKQNKTEDEKRYLDEHIKALGFKVTHDLLSTIKVSDP